MVAKSTGLRSEANNTVLPVFKIHFKFFHFLDLGSIFLIIFLVLGEKFINLPLVFVFDEVQIGLVIEEHDIDVSFCTPAAVTAVSGLIAFPGHRLAAKSPAESNVRITAFSKVGEFSAFNINHCDIFIVHASAALVSGQEKAAVRTPFKIEVTI